MLVDLVAGEGLYLGENFCSKVRFLEKFPFQKRQVTVSRRLEEVIFQTGEGTGLALGRSGQPDASF